MMFAVKVVPSLPMVGLTIAGMTIPFKKFLYWSVLISVIYSVFFFILGFYAGQAYLLILYYFKAGEIAISIIAVISIVGWILMKYWLKKEADFQP